jgi:cytochrome c oxidase subunit 3
VCLGALMILIVWWQAGTPGRFTPEEHFGIEAAELYWHFVDGIWVILYGILYLL